MPTPMQNRTRNELASLACQGMDLSTFVDRVARVVRGVVPFDGACWLTFDPATLLPTSYIPQNSLRPQDPLRLVHNEYLEEDVNKFTSLTRAISPAGMLSEATGGHMERSPRYRDVYRPNGYGDELRLILKDGPLCWGALILHRDISEPVFSEQESVAALSTPIAQGVRRALLIAHAWAKEPDSPGLIVLDAANQVEALTSPADQWLRELLDTTQPGRVLPTCIYAVADRARQIAQGKSKDGGTARARVPTRTGGWLVIHGSGLGAPSEGRVAVIIELASVPEVAQVITLACGLTRREAEVMSLVLRGLSTNEIGDALVVSPYTVQDHLKAIFDKVGVSSRRELAASLVFRHYAPRMAHGTQIGGNGWFVERSSDQVQ